MFVDFSFLFKRTLLWTSVNLSLIHIYRRQTLQQAHHLQDKQDAAGHELQQNEDAVEALSLIHI